MQKDLMGDLQAIERACAGMQLAWDSHDKDLMAALVNKLIMTNSPSMSARRWTSSFASVA